MRYVSNALKVRRKICILCLASLALLFLLSLLSICLFLAPSLCLGLLPHSLGFQSGLVGFRILTLQQSLGHPSGVVGSRFLPLPLLPGSLSRVLDLFTKELDQ